MLLPVVLALLGHVWAHTLKGVMPGLDAIDLQSTAFALRDLETSHFTRRYVSAAGEFEFYNLQPGAKYVLTLDSDTLEIPWSYLVLPGDAEIEVHRVALGRPLNTLSPAVAHPIEVKGYRRSELVVERPTFSVFGFIRQPTVLLAVGALVVVTYLPTLLNSIDPEILEELNKHELKPSNAAEKAQGFDLAKSIADRRIKKEN